MLDDAYSSENDQEDEPSSYVCSDCRHKAKQDALKDKKLKQLTKQVSDLKARLDEETKKRIVVEEKIQRFALQ